MGEEEYYDDQEYYDDEPLPEGPTEPETLTDVIVSKTPWWFISVFVHAVLFAVSALIIVIAKPVEGATLSSFIDSVFEEQSRSRSRRGRSARV